MKRTKNRVKKQNLAGVLLLLMLSTVGSVSVYAQQDSATDVPPPPHLRERAGDGPDPEFRSPMRRPGAQELNGEGGQFAGRRMRRQQMMEDFGGGGPGAGRPFMDGMQPGGAESFDPIFGGRSNGAPEMGFGQRAGMRRGMRGGEGMAQGGPNGFGGRRQGGGATMGGGFGRKLDLTPLNLSEEQKSRIKQLRQGTRERARDVKRGLVNKQMALRNMLFSPDATDVQIRATRKEVRKMQDEMEELNLEDLLSIRGILTAEQRQRLPQIAPGARGQRGPRTADAGPGAGTKSLSHGQRFTQK